MSYTIDLVDEVSKNPLDFADWLSNEGFVKISGVICERCSAPTNLQIRNDEPDKIILKCSISRCGHIQTIRGGSIFYHSHLSILNIIKISIMFVNEISITDASRILSLSPNTVSKYYKDFRKRICDDLLARPIEYGQFGEYEVDETFIEHVMSSDGGHIPQQWVAGFYHRGTGKVKIYSVADRSRVSLIPPIRESIPSGSIICSDTWTSYNCLREHYEHHTVNHSAGEYFRVDQRRDGSLLEVHDNNMESLWSQLKKMVTNKQCRTVPLLTQYMDVIMFKSDGRSLYDLLKLKG